MASQPAHTIIWTIKGTYATWTMTVTTEPPEEPAPGPLPALPQSTFDNLTRYFADCVNLYEATLDHDDHRS